jgi:hypothetical protein
MSHTYERSGKPKLPAWWVAVVFPLLEKVDHAVIANLASQYAGRKSPWKRDAISKFKSGAARTRELANGISLALGVPQPYFEARSAKESQAIAAVMELSGTPSEITPEQRGKLAALDQAAEAARVSTVDQSKPVLSDDEGTHRRRRTRRSTGRRS